jgi:hypothetical protein
VRGSGDVSWPSFFCSAIGEFDSHLIFLVSWRGAEHEKFEV